MQWHVCSLVVQVNPANLAVIKHELLNLPGTEIPAVNQDNNKIIVIVESDDSQALYQQIELIKDMSGVLTVSLIYHQQDDSGEV